jgi:hypothetical protein
MAMTTDQPTVAVERAKLSQLVTRRVNLQQRLDKINEQKAKADDRRDALALGLVDQGTFVPDTAENPAPLKEELAVVTKAIEIQQSRIVDARVTQLEENRAKLQEPSEQKCRAIMTALTEALKAAGELQALREQVYEINRANPAHERHSMPWFAEDTFRNLERAASAMKDELRPHVSPEPRRR